MREFYVVVLVCAASTYLWRALGVGLAQRLNARGEALAWVACVAFAMIAGLIARVLLMPTGALTAATLVERLTAAACALIAYFALTRRNLFVGVVVGAFAVIGLRLMAG